MIDPADRPDLTDADPAIVRYIEWLEAQLAERPATSGRGQAADAEPAEPPTTVNIMTISRNGQAKRTPRHLYGRQRRGGMGVFDLELAEDDAPTALVVADESDVVVVFTSGGRAYRLPVAALPESAVRARGQSLREVIPLSPYEDVVAALPATGSDYVTLLSQRGWVRRVRASFLGPSLIQGTIFHDVKEGGPLAAAARTSGRGDLILVSRTGKAIRFAESQVPVRGCLGLRLDVTDTAVAVAGVEAEGGVFILTRDGLGTVRLMSGFAANKAPGAGGKTAMKAEDVAGAVAIEAGSDLLAISRLGKIIRFAAAEIPAKEGVVQGVSCMGLRADEVAALAALDL